MGAVGIPVTCVKLGVASHPSKACPAAPGCRALCLPPSISTPQHEFAAEGHHGSAAGSSHCICTNMAGSVMGLGAFPSSKVRFLMHQQGRQAGGTACQDQHNSKMLASSAPLLAAGSPGSWPAVHRCTPAGARVASLGSTRGSPIPPWLWASLEGLRTREGQAATSRAVLAAHWIWWPAAGKSGYAWGRQSIESR